jgi:predicted nucleic acid binding AN1-type Zn finger protein
MENTEYGNRRTKEARQECQIIRRYPEVGYAGHVTVVFNFLNITPKLEKNLLLPNLIQISKMMSMVAITCIIIIIIISNSSSSSSSVGSSNNFEKHL